jgi:histidinol-phosphate aminotransferase
MPLQPKKFIAGLKACAHGGFNYTELKKLDAKPDSILDFSVSTNPFMPPPGIREMMKEIPIERYPDSQSGELTALLAERLHLLPENIVVGSGTTELIRLIALAYFRQKDTVLILEPTYGEYEVACRISGARVLRHRALEADGFVPKMDEIAKIVRKCRPRAVFICNPNNPTSKYILRPEIEKVLNACGDALLVLDEAYVTFVENTWNSLDLINGDNVVILRSMTKDYGLPGLRLGYAVAGREISEILRLVMPPWNVNAVAQEAGKAVLEQDKYLRATLTKVQEAKSYLTANLTQLGFHTVPSEAHYFLVKVGNAKACRDALLQYEIMVRDCTSFGLPEYIRVSPRTLPDCEKFIKAMSKIIQGAK